MRKTKDIKLALTHYWSAHKTGALIIGLFIMLGTAMIVRSFAAPIETEEVISGEFAEAVIDNVDGPSESTYIVRQGKENYKEIKIDKTKVKKIPRTGSKVHIKTTIRDNVRELSDQKADNIVVDQAPSPQSTTVDQSQLSQEKPIVDSSEQGVAPAVTPTRVYRRAIVLVNVRHAGSSGVDFRSPVRTETQQRMYMSEPTAADKYWAETSYGNVGVTSTLLGTVNIDVTGPTDCSLTQVSSWADKADAALLAAGKSLNGYTHTSYILPFDNTAPGDTRFASNCTWGGLALVNGKRSWFPYGYLGFETGFNPVEIKRYINGTDAHEFGHNLGLLHASSYQCTSAGRIVTISATCSMADTYGDLYDVMGDQVGEHLLSNNHKIQLGFIPAAKVQTVTASANYTLASSDLNPTATPYPQSLRIAVPNSNPSHFYELEFRSPSGTTFDNFPGTSDVVNGITIRMNPVAITSGAAVTRLLDANPSTTTFGDSAFIRQTFYDSLNQIRVIPVSRSATTAVVNISLRGITVPLPAGDNITPLVNLTSPTINSSSAIGTTIPLAASAVDNIGITSVQFLDGTKVLGTDTTSPYTLDWKTTGSTAGAHTISAKAYDAAGNIAVSAPKTDRIITLTGQSDTTLPRVTISVTPTSLKAGSKVTVTATATDNVGVTRVEFYIDGALQATDTATPFSASLTMAVPGQISVTAKAFDAANNAGASTPVVVTVAKNPVTPPANGDTNNDGHVNSKDYSVVAYYLGQNHAAADLNHDGNVGPADLAILLANWTW